ncbi:alpha/beta hydrolase [Lacticaseibacillus daqingensis]|uniref:alpha/beta hydrolase n=1 Tax=Lacticaseibacillus daqingensis TaxID=2486014 RepID=UPI000F796407|nr:alpha/beta hydrolase [Lacticaseibacillus daqingensis]
MFPRWLNRLGITLGMLLAAVTLGVCLYFYQYAFVPAHKTFLSNHTSAAERSAQVWLKQVPQESWHEQAAGAALRLHAIYVPAAAKTTQTVVVAHGYMGSAKAMAMKIKLFHDAGYNVLAPDDRGHGQSQGDYVGYGWIDRLDYLKWLDQLIRRTGPTSQIALYGESMGGATVMYLSGEKLPKQVKTIIEDCGYTSIMDELSYQANSQFGLPRLPLVPLVALTATVKAGYNVFTASTIPALRRDRLPILFIHGTKDTFVPTSMAKRNYAATTAKKALWLVPGAGHAESLEKHPKAYRQRVTAWLTQAFAN